MANWNNPALTSLYTAFLQELKDRDTDVLTMNPGTTGIPAGAKRFNGALSLFQEWNGSAWNNLVLSAAGGGTGSAAGFPTLGTMAGQNANAVAITGGTITGVALNAGDIATGVLALVRGGTGTSLTLGGNGAFLQSNGAQVVFGVNGAALINLNAGAINAGNLPAAHMPTGGTWTLPALLEINNASYVRFLNGGIIVGPIGYMGAGTVNAQAYFLNGAPFTPGGAGETIPVGLMAIFAGGCPAGWSNVNAAQDRTIRFVNGANGTTGGADTHLHSINSATQDNPAANTGGTTAALGAFESFDRGGSFSGFLASNAQHLHSVPQHSHPISVNSDPASSWPPYIEYMLCRKD